MSFLDAIILGAIQGFTEFLPISSSGHLVIAQKVLGIAEHDLAFDLVLHLGTLLSIVTIYWVMIKKLISTLFQPKSIVFGTTEEGYLTKMVIIGSIPTAAIGLLLKHQFEAMFSDMYSLGVCFIITGLILLLTRLRGNSKFTREQLMSIQGVRKINWMHALVIGVAQGLAIAPSISRSGSTIAAGMMMGIPGPTVALYSFIMSLPAIGGAAILELKDVVWESSRVAHLGVGFIVSYLCGVAGLWLTLQSVRKGRMDIFTIYLVALGAWILYAWT